MYQYDDPSAVPTAPASTAPGTPGYYVDGNAGDGQAPAIVRAEHLNAMQRELLNVLAAAPVPITPSKTVFNQVAAALMPLVSPTGTVGETQHFGLQLFGGVFFKFGLIVGGSGTTGKAVFPGAFPNAIYFGMVFNISGEPSDASIGIGATLVGATNSGGYTTDIDGVAWCATASPAKYGYFAVGY